MERMPLNWRLYLPEGKPENMDPESDAAPLLPVFYMPVSELPPEAGQSGAEEGASEENNGGDKSESDGAGDRAEETWAHMKQMGAGLVAVEADWNADLSPWPMERVFAKGEDFTGHGEAFLQRLLEEAVPAAEAQIRKESYLPDAARRGLIGYSLGGLFALWASTKTDFFSLIGSMSGSLWYEGFLEHLRQHPLCPGVEKVYLSLGEEESAGRHPVLRTVGDATETAREMLREQGIPTTLQWNEGNHFFEAAQRTARGVKWLLGTQSKRQGIKSILQKNGKAKTVCLKREGKN